MRGKSWCLAAVVLATSALMAVGVPAEAAQARSVKIVHYANCTALHKVYPHGVGRKGAHDKVRGHAKPVTTFFVNTALYRANTGLDRDKDGVACEKR